MKNLSPAFLARVAEGSTQLTQLWRIIKRDGSFVRVADHDTDITVAIGSPDPYSLSGTYSAGIGMAPSNIRSTLDMSVDNLEVLGAFREGEITVADIEAGLYDNASVVIFQVDRRDPNDVNIQRSGRLGNFTRTHEGGFRAELRGLTQLLQQPVGRTYGVLCDADLGDARCGVSLTAFTFSGTVGTVVESKRVFFPSSPIITGEVAEVDYFRNGSLTFVTGANAGYSREVKRDATVGSPTLQRFDLYDEFPYDIETGDTFEVIAGCDKKFATCKAKFDNAVNFRGFPSIPGSDVILAGADVKETEVDD